MKGKNITTVSAYGGDSWKPRTATHLEEIGTLWSNCGINSEWSELKSILIHPPGKEFEQLSDPDAVQMIDNIDIHLAREQHKAMVQAYKEEGVNIFYVNPKETPTPNQMFCADLFFMTPEGAILARPASIIRAGEEIWVARRLADLGIPILKTLHGGAIFEGADALWLNDNRVFIGRGLRTNGEAIGQITSLLQDFSVETIPIDLPIGTMHLMGILRFLDKNLVLAWPYRLAWKAVEKLKDSGYHVLFLPDEAESSHGGAINFVTLGPRKILMAEGNPKTQSFLESHNINCITININELLKAAGGIGCLTGIVERKLVSHA